MPPVLTCPKCRHPLPSDAPRGLCPACLLRNGLDGDTSPPGGSDRETDPRAWDDLCQTVSYRPEKTPVPPRAGGNRRAVATPVVDLDQFIQALIEVRLMETAEVRSFLQRYPPESRPGAAEPLARELMKAGKLTEYQAGALLQGKSRGLAIGNYLVLEKIGAGGMGMVFKARHRRLKRVVALKVLPPSYGRNDVAVRRFEREVEAVARLGHPNIVAAFDADEFNGLQFFAMEYVTGSNLNELVDTNGPLAVDRAIAYLTQAARGLKAAHDQGIYHRDIKPSNLMLDSSGTVKVLDLGLARMEKQGDLVGSSNPDLDLTGTGAFMGTIAFMPPEQAYDAGAADHRSDIYSLGCTLHYLLIGKPPYTGATRVTCVLAHRDQPIPSMRAVRPDVAPSVDAILLRMLAKAPEDRYQSIDALIADFEAYRTEVDPAETRTTVVESHPALEAPPAPSAEAAGRTQVPPWRLRRYVAIAASAAVAAALFVGVAIVRRPPGPRVQSTVLRRDHAVVSSPPVPSSGPPLAPPSSSSPAMPPREPVTETSTVATARMEPVGEIRAFRFHESSPVASIAVAKDDDQRIVALSGSNDRTVRYWDVESGKELWSRAHEKPVFAVAFSLRDRRALSAGGDRSMRLWELADGEEKVRFEGHQQPINSVAVSSDGQRGLSGSNDRTARLWDLLSPREIVQLDHHGAVTAVAFAPVGLRALSASDDKTVRLWDFWGDRAKELHCFDGPAAVLCVAFSPDGHRALSGGSDGALSVWNLDEQRLVHRLDGPRGDWVRCVSFLPDGRHALAGTQGGKLIVWDVDERRALRQFDGTPAHLGIAVLPDGDHALTADGDGLVRLWKLP